MFNNKQTLKKIGVFNIFNLKFKKTPRRNHCGVGKFYYENILLYYSSFSSAS